MTDTVATVQQCHSADARAALLDRRTILRAEVGSTAHGVTHSTNDLDEIAVYIPPPIEMLGLHRPEHFIYRPGRGAHDPSGPGDLDRTYYSLAKFVRLLANGNPSILFTLFGPVHQMDSYGRRLRMLRGMFRNQRTQKAYLGYAMAQRERITGERGAAGRVRRSPEGGGAVDWKYAMHMVRLGIQGMEYLTTGEITSPSLELDFLLDVRAGHVPLDVVVAAAEANEGKLKALDLPNAVEQPDQLSGWLADVHQEYWNSTYAYMVNA